jgi:hypothetical protein
MKLNLKTVKFCLRHFCVLISKTQENFKLGKNQQSIANNFSLLSTAYASCKTAFGLRTGSLGDIINCLTFALLLIIARLMANTPVKIPLKKIKISTTT